MAKPTASSYRERYIAALSEQEKAEKQYKLQLDYLRKTLSHLSAAAQGLDPQLDVELIALKEKMRGGSGAQVVAQMEKVQRAVTAFERSREAQTASALDKMSRQIQHLLELQIPPNLQTRLKQYQTEMKTRLAGVSSYPDVAAEIALLQKLALDAAAQPPASFWQRLKGGKTLVPAQQTAKPQTSDDEAMIQLADVSRRDAPLSAASMHEPQSLVSEDDYEKVAKRINQTLRDLVDKIEPNDIIGHKVDIVRSRIQRGLDWYALAVTLEDLRDILMQRYLDVDKEFSEYLQRVNSELAAIGDALGIAVDQGEQQQSAANAFSSAVSAQVEKMRSHMASNSGLDQLKQAVTTHILEIQQALEGYQRSTRPEGDTPSLTDQLSALVERVHMIESESQKTQRLLDEERHRATHDSLTGLPNREAYNQRAYEEMQRFKRYGRPLSLAVCDVDHFKRINDTYGHQAGDKVLKMLAKVLRTRLREVDFIARYGGEEFVILLPETETDNALNVLDKIRSGIGNTPFRFKDEPVTITISFGISACLEGEMIEQSFARADQALYDAKKQGRNRCIIAT